MITEILLFAVGVIVGMMNAIAGGGMLIGFPVLLAAGLPALAANVTGYVVVLPGSASSAYGYRKFIKKVPARYLMLLIPCAVGAIVGSLILRNTSNAKFQEIVPLLILSAVVLFAFQPFIHLQLHRHIHGRNRRMLSLGLIALALFPVAIYGGYFGAGFGFIMLAFLGFTSLHDVHQMNGLKNIAAGTIALCALICLSGTGNIRWPYGLAMAAGALIGGFGGSRLSLKVSSHYTRLVVIIIGLCTAAYLGFRNY